MTKEQRQKIKTLRYQGVGYGKIAKATGLSRDSVSFLYKRRPKWICVRVGNRISRSDERGNAFSCLP